MRDTGVNPPLGGMEYAEDIINAMDLDYLERNDESLGKLLNEVRHIFQEWYRTEHPNARKLREGSETYVLPIDANNRPA